MIWQFLCVLILTLHTPEGTTICVCVPQDMLDAYCLSCVCTHPKCKIEELHKKMIF